MRQAAVEVDFALAGKDSSAGLRFLNGSKSKVLGGAAGLFFPLFEEAAVAQGELLFRGDAKDFRQAIDPAGRAFELGEDAERCFIEDAVGGRIQSRVFPLRAPFFVAEGGKQTDGGEDVGEGLAVGCLLYTSDAADE